MERLHKAVEIACIKDFVMALPLNFSTKIGRDGVGLSQGQKQRILIARAVYKNPNYIFFERQPIHLMPTMREALWRI